MTAETSDRRAPGGNRHWLDVALGNLVSNALRYGEGTITIGTHAETRDGSG